LSETFAQIPQNNDRIVHVKNVIALTIADLQPSVTRR
jgi:hypothetical protein